MNEAMNRPSSGAVARGLVVVMIAVVVGVLLLRSSDDAITVAAGDDSLTAPGVTSPVNTTVAVDTEVPTDTTTDATTAETGTESTEVPGETAAPTDTTVAPEASTPATAVAVDGFDPRPSNEVRVQVANSTGIAGVAGSTTEDLSTRNYITLTAANILGTALPRTKVYHEPGWLLEAQAVAQVLGLDPQTDVFRIFNDTSAVEPYEDPNVLVVLGLDMAEG
ncbi:MAG: hypothetical protein ACI91O_000887 [Candidatus Poriferisodalaceae bacterium]|jgi:hypothetical protein